ncbi:hypothetical protein GC163_00665 [bacterium]|nr:hypothetical protein [bacterium]
MNRCSPTPGACRSRYVLTFAACVSCVSLVTAEEFRSVAPATAPRQAVMPAGDLDAKYYAALKVIQPGTSDHTVRQQAVQELDVGRLAGDARAKATQVVKNISFYRRLPLVQFAVNSEVYQHFLTHPDVAVSTWRALEISRFELRAQGENVYHADAQDGSVGTVEVWRSTPDEVVIYCDGAFKSPLLLKPIVARSVMRLKMRFFTGADGVPQVEHTGDVFVEFPSQTIETVARLISPVSCMIADRNFKQLSLYVNLMSLAMEQQPVWVQVMLRRMDAPESQKQELRSLADRVQLAAAQRLIATPQGTMLTPVDDIVAPLRVTEGPTGIRR